jgi:ATP-dependent protease ClpP protease subunit
MNPFEFVLALIIIVFAFAIIRHKIGMPDRSLRGMMRGHSEDSENAQLRSQVQQLQNRIRVLERIVTDSGVQTAAQIEALRDRDTIDNGNQVQ